MRPNRGTRFLPLLVTLIIAAVVIAALVSIGRAIFTGGDSTDTTEKNAAQSALLSTDDSRSVQMVVRGPIVAEEKFETYRILVSPNGRRLDIYSGYLDQRSGGKVLGNNTEAYEQFVYALDKANMTKSRSATTGDDIRGICADGYVYEFSIRNMGDTVQKLWTSNCGGSPGTLNASKDQLGSLFLDQIPGSEDLIPFRNTSNLQF